MNNQTKKNLFLEIGNKNFTFLVGEYDNFFNLKIIEKISIKSKGIKNGKITNLQDCSEIIQKTLKEIEDKIEFTFTNLDVIVSDYKNYSCINVSGYKKLNGSQILQDDISFIINDLKRNILIDQKQKSIIHLFNSKYILDRSELENMPIGLHGDFYSHQLTFFLMENNDLRNINLLFKKFNLKTNRTILKTFLDGINFIQKNKSIEKQFIKILFNEGNIQILIFDNLSLIYAETLDFGTDIIIQDVSKVCSIDQANVKEILSSTSFEEENNKNDVLYLDKKYFKNRIFRKISLSLIRDVVTARVEEIMNIIFNKNMNVKFFKNKRFTVYFIIKDKSFLNNFQYSSKKFLTSENKVEMNLKTQDELYDGCMAASDLITKGWSREALPIIRSKKSLISSIFSALFE